MLMVILLTLRLSVLFPCFYFVFSSVSLSSAKNTFSRVRLCQFYKKKILTQIVSNVCLAQSYDVSKLWKVAKVKKQVHLRWKNSLRKKKDLR